MEAVRSEQAQPQLLVVEDETNIRHLICSHMQSEGYECVAAADGHQALEIIATRLFDVVVLDIMLPGVDGLTLCRTIRHRGLNRQVPILLLTARREERDKLEGFALGADDYLTKPFSMNELGARLSALRRRTRGATVDPLGSSPPISTRDLQLDPPRRSVMIRGVEVAMTPYEFRLLYRLASNRGVVFTRERLLAEIWHGEAFVTERSVDTLVRRLRCKVERDPAMPTCIVTVWGEGYKFVDA